MTAHLTSAAAEPVTDLDFDTCTVSDALDRLGLVGVVPGIGPLWDGGRVAGRVRTVGLRRFDPNEDGGSRVHLGAQTIARCGPGEVIVVAHQGRTDSAGWGGLLCGAAQRAGVSGVVVHGACRDVDDAVALGLPLFAAAATPVTARGRTVEESFDEPVQLGDITVASGDLVFADRSGVVFVAAHEVDRVLAVARELRDTELAMRSALRDGVPVTTVLGGGRYDAMLTDSPSGDGSTP